MLPWDDVRIFLAAHEHGSFTAAAKALGLGQATLSRRLAALEDALGHALFVRSTRGLTLTPMGEALLPHAREMGRHAGDMEAAVRGLEAEPSGWVRLGAPPGLASAVVAPMVPRFAARWPQIRLEVREHGADEDLDRQEADLALQTHRPTRSELVAQRLRTGTPGLFASEGYVARLPRDPILRDLEFIAFTRAADADPSMTWLRERGLEARIVMRADGIGTQREAAAAGVGVVLLEPMIAARAGLVPVPVEHAPLPTVETFLVVPMSLTNVPRIVAVADFVRDVIAFVDAHGRLPSSDDRLERARTAWSVA